MDEYEREDRAVATVREWLTSTYGTKHYATEQAMNSKHNVLPALFTATIDEPSRQSLPQHVLDAWAELIAAERRRLELYEDVLSRQRVRR